ncbi:hypothetical protein [Flavobacterium collinsii]|uniref:Uncharacterized protein n=1 Tax=Flavobacterium collinsii TaxID=1114861 RepID=A0ABN7EJB9_9FLAO|nr:hypothetical protein [Flavobacterium collinsii]CAA9197440.1 hypothetical protein FLACOL7796_01664 [Flavobacterium collinsii]
MKKINEIGLSNLINKLTRNEMRNLSAGNFGPGGGASPSCGQSGLPPCDAYGGGEADCLPACSTGVTKNSDCCSGMSVSGNYPPCGGDRGRVCL